MKIIKQIEKDIVSLQEEVKKDTDKILEDVKKITEEPDLEKTAEELIEEEDDEDEDGE